MVGIKSTRVIGIKDLQRRFQELARDFDGATRAEIALVGGRVIAKHIRRKIVERDLIESGELLDSVEAIKVNQWSAGVVVGAIHAATHEFGSGKMIITERQRAFFWAMWDNGRGDDKWKALALSAYYEIPARPYVRPGISEGKQEAVEAMQDYVARRIGVYGI